MDKQELYESIMNDLARDVRPQVKLSPEQVAHISKEWNEILQNWNSGKETELKKILCIVDHTQTLSQSFIFPIIQSLSMDLPNELMIYALASAQKHIVTKCALDGIALPSQFIEVMKRLLANRDPEIFEWVIITIESTGNQSIKFKESVLKNKPSMLTFNIHLKRAKNLITVLEKKWK